MNKIQALLILTNLLIIGGVATFLMVKDNNETTELQGKFTLNLSPSFVFYQDYQVNDLIISMQGKESKQQLDLLNEFMKKGHLFFSGNQISMIINSTFKGTLASIDAINIMKPYLPPLSTDEAIQTIPQISSFALPTSQIIKQIYDLNDENIIKVMNTIPYAMYFKVNYLTPQTQVSFSSGFKLTTEGSHVGLLIDKTASMNTIVSKRDDGTNVTRFNLLQQFFSCRFDIFQSFSTFSYQLFNYREEVNYYRSLLTFGQESNRGLNAYIYNQSTGDGETDIYSNIASLLSESEDQMSDLYILTDGIVTKGIKEIESFIKLINDINNQRKIKVRINTISFLVGGQETFEERQHSYQLLQALSDATRGTFIQFKSSQ